ncbi:hypothetical protein BDW74DRAFT_168325 [Aspergillus multicolor]|uniref:Zn(II)2Cys6 transcription factor n=1 Tax=Aspergillus multicolor TaxID=41759 RepID=UPI003CCE1DCB
MPPSINACLSCRKVKMKCVTTTESGKCDRCTRKTLTCVFREHCRGRKPGMRQAGVPEPPPEQFQSRPTGFWDESDGFQPHGLLNHQAMKGNFSLQNILSVDHETNNPKNKDYESPSHQQRHSASNPSISPDDPVLRGLINLHVATHLHEYFMSKINPYISQLDPVLHTFAYLRKSPFLLTTVLAVAAKAFESALYPPLHEHAEKLYVDSFRRGDKSTEIIQAILLLTYWKEPNDTRAWTSVGLAIRIALDLGWHKLTPNAGRKHGLSEYQRREARNIERTFLVLFVYDRSLSLQTGKPWMIERNELIDVAESCWRDDDGLANPNDQLLSAFTALRLITADIFNLLSPSKTPPRGVDRLLGLIDQRIHEWQNKWLKVVSSNSDAASGPGASYRENACHTFLVKFYGAHLRLQLFSVPLQETRIRNTHWIFDLKPFWLSYQSALDMMQLVTDSSGLLYLAQDSVHVMTAYAAIFLIKLLLSSPHSVRQEIESITTKAIRGAAETFASLSAPPSSSCALQARFLQKILHEYIDTHLSRSRPVERAHSIPGERDPGRTRALRHEKPEGAQPGFVDQSEASSQPDTHSRGLLAQYSAPPIRPNAYQTYGHTLTHANHTADLVESDQASMQPNLNPPTPFDYESEGLGFLFDEDKWDEMFASAGFSIQEGVFFR